MMRRFRAWPVLLLLPLMAQAQWKDRDGSPLPDESWRKSDGNFGAALQIATEAEFGRFNEEWHSTKVEHTPSLATTDLAHRGDLIRVLLVYSGCAASSAEPARCLATLHLRVTKPDGTVYADIPDLMLAGEQPPTAGVVQLSPASLQIRFEPEDPLGRYRIEAWLSDPTQDAELQLSDSIRLTATN